ncbi:hypothetical protein CTI12_AA439110 [Artemisia annua]|uniref:Zinc knuckle CX2CX4HX4C n=1 Tax=Artemisia annua TaxID=35608 RepID=A0A2U1LYG4_ARTAN|nr:hypothetical protein CTI12_AA439110 [Artemisia annua]
MENDGGIINHTSNAVTEPHVSVDVSSSDNCDDVRSVDNIESVGTELHVNNRVGKADYARVLVEFDVKKGFKEKIVIQYRNKENEVKGSKTVNIEYLWKPEICSHYSVFGHDVKKCSKRPRTAEELEKK